MPVACFGITKGNVYASTDHIVDRLANSHAVVVVIVGNDLRVLRLLHKLVPGFPRCLTKYFFPSFAYIRFALCLL